MWLCDHVTVQTMLTDMGKITVMYKGDGQAFQGKTRGGGAMTRSQDDAVGVGLFTEFLKQDDPNQVRKWRKLDEAFGFSLPKVKATIVETVDWPGLNTTVIFTPLATCLDQAICKDCHSFPGPIRCSWNPKTNECIVKDNILEEDICTVVHKTNQNKLALPDTEDYLYSKPVNQSNHRYYKVKIRSHSSHLSYNLTNNNSVEIATETANITMPFAFPFYGHPVREVIMTNRGFLALPSVKQSNLHETQYIAPLMSNFDLGSPSI